MKGKTLIISRETEDKEMITFRDNIINYNNIKFQIKQFQEKEKKLKEWFKFSGYSQIIWEIDRENNAVFKISSYKTTRKTIDKEKLIFNIQKEFGYTYEAALKFVDECSNTTEVESVKIG